MKRILFLIIMVLSSAVAVTAQEVLVVKMKDGREFTFKNGIENSSVYFWGSATKGEEHAEFTPLDQSAQWQPELEGLRVADYSKSSGQYAVAIAWPRMSDLPESARMGICIGKEPNVSVENCDTIYYAPLFTYIESLSNQRSLFIEQLLPIYSTGPKHTNSYYVLLGDSLTFFRGNLQYKWTGTRVSNNDSSEKLSWMNYPLTNGETYYYRIFANLPYNERTENAVFYGPEMSFRVPNLKADAGYDNGDIYFSDDAWASFMQHFPADMTSYKLAIWQKVLHSLQKKWEATLDASPYDLATATKLTFDDGIAYFLPEVPEAFYTWMSSRELVINASHESEYCSAEISVNNLNVPQTSFEIVNDVDASLEIPSNSYLVCTPAVYENSSNRNVSFYFNFSEAVPGIRYKLTITFAPETRYTPEQDETGKYIGENASHFLPAPLRIYSAPLTSKGNTITPWGAFTGTNLLARYETVATAKDVFELYDEKYNFSCSVLRVESNARTSQLNRSQTNEVHIAEVRLTPILNNEEEVPQ